MRSRERECRRCQTICVKSSNSTRDSKKKGCPSLWQKKTLRTIGFFSFVTGAEEYSCGVYLLVRAQMGVGRSINRLGSSFLGVPMSIVVVGSIAFDTIKTPFGEREKSLGGAANYFAVAAQFFSKVQMVGIIGEDFP